MLTRGRLRRLKVLPRRDDDPGLDCTEFEPGVPAGDCETDGHYRCVECRWMREGARDDGGAE